MKIIVIGVGGTGCKVVNIVENENDLSHSDINFIYIDSNENSLKNYNENLTILLRDAENTKNFDDINVAKNATYYLVVSPEQDHCLLLLNFQKKWVF